MGLECGTSAQASLLGSHSRADLQGDSQNFQKCLAHHRDVRFGTSENDAAGRNKMIDLFFLLVQRLYELDLKHQLRENKDDENFRAPTKKDVGGQRSGQER